jgi:uncharacterized delta-60 repeat protein
VAVIVFAAMTGCGGGVRADTDTQFGTAGKVRTDFGGDEVANALVIQADGKIVAAGHKGRAFALARYTRDGELDASFGTAGRVVTDFGVARKCMEPFCRHGAAAVSIQGDGKIVAAGGKGSEFALARYLPDGRLDRAFGRGGQVVTDVGARPNRFQADWQRGAKALAILPDGKIIVAGAGPGEFALARYTPNGRLDGSFGRGGLVFTGFQVFQAGAEDYAEALAVQTDGKIVAAGRSFTLFALARYMPNGRLDATFGTGGKALPNVGGDDYDVAEAVATQVDGKIVVVGWTGARFPGAIVARLTSRGRFDPSFGSGGMASGAPSLGAGPYAVAGAYAVAIARDGKIVTAGYESYLVNTCCSGRYVEKLVLSRYGHDGRPDPTFGKRGAVEAGFGKNLQVTAVAIDGDGKIVVAGGSGRSLRNRDFLLVRYGRDGSIDS